MSGTAEGGEDVNGEVAAEVVRGLVESVDCVFDPVDEFDDVGYRICPVRIVVCCVALLLGGCKENTKFVNRSGEFIAQASTTEFVPGRAVVGCAVGLLPGPPLLVCRCRSNQGVGVAGGQRMEQGVVSATDGATKLGLSGLRRPSGNHAVSQSTGKGNKFGRVHRSNRSRLRSQSHFSMYIGWIRMSTPRASSCGSMSRGRPTVRWWSM